SPREHDLSQDTVPGRVRRRCQVVAKTVFEAAGQADALKNRDRYGESVYAMLQCRGVVIRRAPKARARLIRKRGGQSATCSRKVNRADRVPRWAATLDLPRQADLLLLRRARPQRDNTDLPAAADVVGVEKVSAEAIVDVGQTPSCDI